MAPAASSPDHKRLLVLGLLQKQPLTGYDLYQVVTAHGELYSDLKKPNLYHLLGRMEADGLVRSRTEGGARGPRRERLRYSLTRAGRSEMDRLLRTLIVSFEPVHTGLDVAIVLLEGIPPDEARQLLHTRLELVRERRETLAGQLDEHAGSGSAGDHLLCLVDAEIAWVERAIRRFRRGGRQAGHAE